LAAVPKPDASRLDNQIVELSLDFDATLEAGSAVAARSGTGGFAPLLPGDIQGAPGLGVVH
jgi:hypothetical protein